MSFYQRAQKRTSGQSAAPLTLSDAKKKLMDFIARRDHSEKELRQKLSLRCAAEVVEKTLAWAQAQKWLTPPEKLKTQFAAQLARRGKGILKINQKLKELGLETVKSEQSAELEKAKKLVLAKWSTADFKGLAYKDAQKLKARIMRFLAARGYESNIISLILSLILKNEFKKSLENYENPDSEKNTIEQDTNEENTYDEEF